MQSIHKSLFVPMCLHTVTISFRLGVYHGCAQERWQSLVFDESFRAKFEHATLETWVNASLFRSVACHNNQDIPPAFAMRSYTLQRGSYVTPAAGADAAPSAPESHSQFVVEWVLVAAGFAQLSDPRVPPVHLSSSSASFFSFCELGPSDLLRSDRVASNWW